LNHKFIQFPRMQQIFIMSDSYSGGVKDYEDEEDNIVIRNWDVNCRSRYQLFATLTLS